MSAEKTENILANVKATMSMENLNLTDEETEIIRKYLQGAYTEKEVLEIMKNL